MEALLTLINEYKLADIIVLIGLLATAGTGVYTIYKKIVDIFESYRIRRNSIDDKERLIQDKFDNISTEIEQIKKTIELLQQRCLKLEKSQNSIQTDLNKFNKTTSKSALYKLVNELNAKQWMSQTESETLQELSDIYMKSGDSHFVIPNPVQRALSLPVLTDEEIDAKLRNANRNRQQQ